MKISVIIATMLVAQVSASFFDVFQGAVLSVQNSFGKLLSDVVTDVKETVDCTILAVEHVLSLSEDATARYYKKCGGAKNVTQSNIQSISPILEISIGNNQEYLEKELPGEIDARINETLSQIFNGYNPHDRLEDVEKELAAETERLAAVNDLVRQELDRLSNEIHLDFSKLERKGAKPSVESILDELKVLEAVEQNIKNPSEANEIHRLIDGVLNKLHEIESSETLQNAKVDGVLKDLEKTTNGTYKDIRQRLEDWKAEEARHLDVIQNKIKEHEKLPQHLEYIQKNNTTGIQPNSSKTDINTSLISTEKPNTVQPDNNNKSVTSNPSNIVSTTENLLSTEIMTKSSIPSITLNMEATILAKEPFSNIPNTVSQQLTTNPIQINDASEMITAVAISTSLYVNEPNNVVTERLNPQTIEKQAFDRVSTKSLDIITPFTVNEIKVLPSATSPLPVITSIPVTSSGSSSVTTTGPSETALKSTTSCLPTISDSTTSTLIMAPALTTIAANIISEAITSPPVITPEPTASPPMTPAKATTVTSFEPTTSPLVITLEPTVSSPVTTPEATTARQVTTPEPTTTRPVTTPEPTTARPVTSAEPTTARPVTTPEPTTARPVMTPEPTTARPVTTPEPTTARPVTSPELTTARPVTTPEPTTARPVTSPEPTTALPVTSPELTTARPVTTPGPTTARPVTTPEPTKARLVTTPEPTTTRPVTSVTTLEPTTTRPVTTQEPTTIRPVTTPEPTTTRPVTVTEPTATRPVTTIEPTSPATTSEPDMNPPTSDVPDTSPPTTTSISTADTVLKNTEPTSISALTEESTTSPIEMMFESTARSLTSTVHAILKLPIHELPIPTPSLAAFLDFVERKEGIIKATTPKPFHKPLPYARSNNSPNNAELNAFLSHLPMNLPSLPKNSAVPGHPRAMSPPLTSLLPHRPYNEHPPYSRNNSPPSSREIHPPKPPNSDFNSFFHVPTKETNAHDRALREARKLIQDSQRAHRLINNIANKKKKGLNAFNLPRSFGK